MAFALSLKSKIDMPETGKSFLIITLIITSFTLLYSSVLLNTVLERAELQIVKEPENQRFFQQMNCFDRTKDALYRFHLRFLIPRVYREQSQYEESRSKSLIEDMNERSLIEREMGGKGDMTEMNGVHIEEILDKEKSGNTGSEGIVIE